MISQSQLLLGEKHKIFPTEMKYLRQTKHNNSEQQYRVPKFKNYKMYERLRTTGLKFDPKKMPSIRTM